MRRAKCRGFPWLIAAVAATAGCGAKQPASPELVVREGYRVTVAVEDLPGARFLEMDASGTLYVSRPQRGDIVSLRDEDGDGVFELRRTFVSGYASAHGMHLHDGWLWFSTSTGVHKARDTTGDGIADEVVDIFPRGSLTGRGGHWWRSLLVTDEYFFTSVGDTGNISDERGSDRQKIFRYRHDGSDKTLWSSGIRNTEKLRMRPGTEEIWGFDHGSDWFGQRHGDKQGNQPITDLWPPEELNKYVRGGFYGHPFITGPRIPRPEYHDHPELHELAAKTIPPEMNLPAHWAINGWAFIEPSRNKGALPREHEGDVYFAAHGSWNSTEPVGYCIGRVLFDEGKPYGMLQIVKGFDSRGRVTARPVDVVQAPDGRLFFSTDAPRGMVFRLEWVGP
ncbi:MAG: PQQ-dependent sugar dehydrogenase [Phycisphaeraceae bacterium]|nr:PQQ-dependent sugar dehydrogenase [Phycisphaeraceae bacterium]